MRGEDDYNLDAGSQDNEGSIDERCRYSLGGRRLGIASPAVDSMSQYATIFNMKSETTRENISEKESKNSTQRNYTADEFYNEIKEEKLTKEKRRPRMVNTRNSFT